MIERLLEFIQRTLSTRITPIAYLFIVYDFFYALGLALPTGDKGAGAEVLSKIEPLIGSEIWGLALLFCCVLIFVGMLTKTPQFIDFGAFFGFGLWTMAAIAYLLSGYIWIHLPMALLQILIFGYYFLATSLGRLWDWIPDYD